MGTWSNSDLEVKMFHLVLAGLLACAAARPQLPANVDASFCPNYPFCSIATPADFPTPVVNGEPIAPILNTNPAQTLAHQQHQLVRSPADFPVPVINGQNVAPVYNTVPAQTAAHENHLLIAQQQQLQQLIDALKARCDGMGLQPRGTRGESGGQTGHTYDISNKHRLGYSEVQLVQTMIDGVNTLRKEDLELQKKHNM